MARHIDRTELLELLRTRFEAAGISRAELARRASVSAMAVTHALENESTRYDETRAKLLRALSVSVSEDRFWRLESLSRR